MEVLIAISVSLMVSVIILFVLLQGMKNIRQVKSWESLNSNAAFLTETLGYWVKQSKKMEPVSGPSDYLKITLPDSSSKTFKKDGDNFVIDNGDGSPVLYNTADVKITSLVFTPLNRSARIEMTVVSKDTGRDLSVTTTVAQRNQF